MDNPVPKAKRRKLSENDKFVSEVESEEPSLDWLPNEVLELVFCRLPLQQLFTSCRLVSRGWNSIIMRERFLCWKKRYHFLKSNHQPTIALIEQLLHQANIIPLSHQLASSEHTIQEYKPHPYLAYLARFSSKEFSASTMAEGTLPVLKQHPRYSCVQQIATLHPELKDAESQLPGVMETITLLVACSRNVHEVHFITEALLTPPASEGNCFREPLCGVITMIELFYCLATLFFDLWNKKILPPRFHYYVFYILHALECGSSTILCQQQPSTRQRAIGQQSLLTYRGFTGSGYGSLTAEQLLIVNHYFKPGEIVKIVAFAGTGKTTTLLRLTQLNPTKKFLYCVFNKSVKERAVKVFPKNVKCSTFHALAWKSKGASYKHKTTTDFDVYKVFHWIKTLSITGNMRESLYVFSKRVLVALKNFIASDKEEICTQHVPRERGMWDFYESKCNTTAIMNAAKKIWIEMQDCNNNTVKMTHDGYLKLFQLEKPTIDEYDHLLIDEAQDLTPAIIDILMGQRCPKIFVGDPHQQIYTFRGAKNALELVQADHTFYLTKSFRFGPEIAYVASCILDTLKGVRKETLVGGLKPGGIQGETNGQVAIIARCNTTLFTELVKLCDSGEKVKIGFAGGIKKYEFKKYLDIHKLKQGKSDGIEDPSIKRFKTFEELKSFAISASDTGLLEKIKTCERYPDLPRYIEKIRGMTCKDRNIKLADKVFSTAHKSKGLEFSTVQLTDDYLMDHEGLSLDVWKDNVDECNLLYVAVTRAKKQLIMTPTLMSVLKRAGEHFVYPTAATEAMALRETVCPLCTHQEPLPELRLERLQIALKGTPRPDPSAVGYLCKTCSLWVMPSLYL